MKVRREFVLVLVKAHFCGRVAAKMNFSDLSKLPFTDPQQRLSRIFFRAVLVPGPDVVPDGPITYLLLHMITGGGVCS